MLFIRPPLAPPKGDHKPLQSPPKKRMRPIGCDRPEGPRRFRAPCSEQGKLPAAKAFRLAERDKHMSEKRKAKQVHPAHGQRGEARPQIEVSELPDEVIIAKGFMEDLDLWTDTEVLTPVVPRDEEGIPTDGIPLEICQDVKASILKKVLESYRSGFRAGMANR